MHGITVLEPNWQVSCDAIGHAILLSVFQSCAKCQCEVRYNIPGLLLL